MTQVQTRVDRVGSQCSTNCATMLCYRCKLEILFLYLMRLSSSSWLEEQMFLTILLLYYSNKNRYLYNQERALKSSDGSSLRLSSGSARARLFLGCPGLTFFGRA